MYIDSGAIDRDALIESDICVVGAGAAGITLARSVLDSGLSVVLLESGSFAYDEATQDLYSGTETGTFLPPDTHYLTTTRTRYLGGTGNHWNGWCRPMDAEDFETRDWVEGSGWPLTQTELDPFYRRARRVVQITSFESSRAPASIEVPPIGTEGDVETSFLHISPPTRFQKRYARSLKSSRDLRVYLNSNATQILVNPSASVVEGLEVASLAGNRFRVRARAYVLATGGIENARLLLASNRVQAKGLGNSHDLVGRYFMEHPILRVGFLVVPGESDSMQVYRTYHRESRKYRGILRVRPEVQRQHRLLNALAILKRRRSEELPELVKQVESVAGEISALKGKSRANQNKTYFGTLGIAGEQTPNPHSRVHLIDERDALGVPRIRLDWRVTEEDSRSIRLTAEILARQVAITLGGRGHLLVTEDNPWPGTYGSSHHMGTTRMDPDPKQGVVDVDCKVNGVSNLWVAGSSVFPTVGCSNPTLTIVALTLRLSDHLTSLLST